MSTFQLAALTASIPALDAAAMKAVAQRLDTLTKPPGSLGRLERLAVQLAGIQGQTPPVVSPAAVFVMAGDHGVTAEGVSAFPAEVTVQMVLNFLRGGAAINVLSRLAGAKVYVADVGVKGDIPEGTQHANFLARKVRAGTANMAQGPAMSLDEAVEALGVGAEAAARAAAEGARVLAVGEMGIGNTTPATALLCVFTGVDPEQVVGRGTGVDDAGLQRKVAAIRKAVAVNVPDPARPLESLAAVGGLEIAAMAGYILQGASLRRPVVIDGLISSAAALVAYHLCPAVREFLIPSHQSQEPGHRLILEHLQLAPLYHLDMRLGEGTGAVLALHLLEAAVRILTEMATFAEAGVSNRE